MEIITSFTFNLFPSSHISNLPSYKINLHHCASVDLHISNGFVKCVPCAPSIRKHKKFSTKCNALLPVIT